MVNKLCGRHYVFDVRAGNMSQTEYLLLCYLYTDGLQKRVHLN